jgi:HPt (histidine-containing phosphotransfer) domain-containing protein
MTPTEIAPEITSVLSLDSTLANLGGDAELLRELLDFFVEIAPQQLDELQAAVAAGDQASVQLQAHSMKGGAANVGVVRMMTIARDLELLARDGSLEGAEAMVQALRDEFASLQAIMPRIDWQVLV